MLEGIEFVNRKNKLKLLSKKVRIAILTAALLLNTTASNTLIAFAAAEDSTDSEITVASDEDNNKDGGDEFITLSTCAYHTKNGRFAVVGKRVE